MLKPITLEDYKQYQERRFRETSLVSCVLGYAILSFNAKTLLFVIGSWSWRLFGLLFICQVLVLAVVTGLEFLIMLWLARLPFALPQYALNEQHPHPKAVAILMMGLWRNERILQVFSIVATVTGVVWIYRFLAPIVEGL